VLDFYKLLVFITVMLLFRYTKGNEPVYVE